MKIVCISDTHLRHEKVRDVPDGDVLVCSGDITGRGELERLNGINRWFSKLPHKHKILVAGNHDFCFQDFRAPSESALSSVLYLQDASVEIEGVRFYGTPYQPFFCDWAFNVRELEKRRDIFSLIPEETDVLITHCPPHGILDEVPGSGPVGCGALLGRVLAIRPKVHIFGHIHGQYGEEVLDGIRFVNASLCNDDYRIVNDPVVVEI